MYGNNINREAGAPGSPSIEVIDQQSHQVCKPPLPRQQLNRVMVRLTAKKTLVVITYCSRRPSYPTNWWLLYHPSAIVDIGISWWEILLFLFHKRSDELSRETVEWYSKLTRVQSGAQNIIELGPPSEIPPTNDVLWRWGDTFRTFWPNEPKPKTITHGR